MAYCMNCGKKLGEGAKFCTNCGKPVPGAVAKDTGNRTAPAQQKRKNNRSFNIGRTDFRKLNNVRLVTTPELHRKFHIVFHLMSLLILIYLLVVFFPVALPLLNLPEGSEIPYVPGMFPGITIVFVITIICGLMTRKIRYDIIRSLPKGFEYWKIRRMLRWEIFGFESIKTAVLRLLGNKELLYPELGIGTDDEGNYYAFTVPGDETERYPLYTASDH